MRLRCVYARTPENPEHPTHAGTLRGGSTCDHGPAVVIDWEQGRPDAPVGLDAVFIELNRLAIGSQVPIGIAATRAVYEPASLAAPPSLGGVPWGDADQDLRVAMVVAALVVHALGPEGDRRGQAWAETNLHPLLATLSRGAT